MDHRGTTELAADHTPEAVAVRLASVARASLLGDALLGAMDGAVTTFALVAGGIGAGLAPRIALVFGLANIAADGLSMAIGNHERARSEQALRERAREIERDHVERIPEGEREEVRQIYARKGFEGELLEEIVARITADRERWIETMLSEEIGLERTHRSPLAIAVATFLSFVLVGLVPLAPLAAMPERSPDWLFAASSALTAAAFFVLGVLRGRILRRGVLRAGLETLLLGALASSAAWGVGSLFRGEV